jgi:hypothetical protein
MKQVLTNAQWDQRLQEAAAIEQALNGGKKIQGKSDAEKADAKKEGEKSYKFFENEEEFMQKFKVWETYDLERKYSRDFQRRYEAFCCGWLEFWDREISLESEKRQLYIKWTQDKNDKNKDILILYISKETPPKTETIGGPGDPPVVPPPPPPDQNS